MREVGILQAKTSLSALIADVERTGEEIVLTRHGRAAAKIVPVSARPATVPGVDRQAVIKRVLANRDARPVLSDWEDLSWDVLKRIARDEDRYD